MARRFISDRIQVDTIANNFRDKQATVTAGSYLTANKTDSTSTKTSDQTAKTISKTALNTASNTASNTPNTATSESQLPPVPPPSYENQQPPIPAVEVSFNKRSPPKILFDRIGKREHQLSVASSSGFNPTISLHMMDSTPDSPRGAIRSAYTQADSLLVGATANSPNETDGSRGDQSITDLYQKNLDNNPNVNTNNNRK